MCATRFYRAIFPARNYKCMFPKDFNEKFLSEFYSCNVRTVNYFIRVYAATKEATDKILPIYSF